ncbi:MAG: acyl-CoA/acyl-ACP dehydrogenase [Pseudonocardiales bacterium]|nr:acyl-CoA/acyl-ACP dehydrogenase [Pseudonocardiales bacterium]
MRLVLDPEQEQLRAALRDLLAGHATSAHVRVAMAKEPGHDPALWARLGELGALGLVVPEEHGGSGAGHVERAIAAGELGRVVAPSPFLGSAVLAIDTLLALDGGSDLLPALAAGELIGTIAVAAPGHGLLEPGPARALAHTGGWALDGVLSPVVDGVVADVLLVYALADDGLAFFRVDADALGMTRTALRTLDPTRRLAHVTLDATPATRLDGDAAVALAHVTDLAGVALAAGQLGLLRRSLERTVEYAKVRTQFGRAIGSYQAVKHGLADMEMALELGESAVRYAAWVADHDRAALPLAAATAQAYLGPAAFAGAQSMVQFHGGIGYTWEHDAHLYYKRAKSDQLLLGPPAAQRARLATLLELDE